MICNYSERYRDSVSLELKGRLPDFNTVVMAAKSKWGGGAYMRIKKESTNKVADAFESLALVKITPPISAVFVWHLKDRRRDPDNIASGVKFIFDGMVKSEVIRNDSMKYIKSWTNEFDVTGEDGVGVTIYYNEIDEA